MFTALFKYNITSVEIKNASFKVRHTLHYLSEWGSLKRENKQMKKKKLLTMWKTVQKMGIKKKREREIYDVENICIFLIRQVLHMNI